MKKQKLQLNTTWGFLIAYSQLRKNTDIIYLVYFYAKKCSKQHTDPQNVNILTDYFTNDDYRYKNIKKQGAQTTYKLTTN